MDDSPTQKLETKVSKKIKPETQASKRRKLAEKTVVKVKIDGNVGKQKSEGPPSDSWSWRKYGQKPIKGSPYPRGYYRCSTAKGCSAKKQVERCRTDASMFVITYSSTHNHADPDHLHTTNLTQKPNKEAQSPSKAPNTEEEILTIPKQEQESPPPPPPEQPTMTSDKDASTAQDHFHYFQSPFSNSQDNNPFKIDIANTTTHESVSSRLLFDEEPLSYPHLMTFSSTLKSDENDFFDELEELLPPTSSSYFTSFMGGISSSGSSFFDERILVQLS